jgi:two-component system, OmpR family, phosphate regulon sensor histidine kinase PhoR
MTVGASAQSPDSGGREGRTNPHDTVQRRLQRLVLAVLLLIIVVGSVGVGAVVLGTGNVVTLTSVYGPANDANAAALEHMLDAESAVRTFRVNHSPTQLQAFRSASSAATTSLTELSRAMASAGQHRYDTEIARQRALADSWLTGFAVPVTSGRGKAATDSQAMRTFDQFRTTNASLSTEIKVQRLKLRRDTARLRQVAIVLTCAASLAAVLAVAILGLRTASGIANPLAAVRSVLGRIDSGDLKARASETAGPDEVRTLARAVNDFGRRSQADIAAEDVAEDLRLRTRLVSLAIRRIEDPQRLAQHLVTGLGEAIGADRVALRSFADIRVPALLAQWHRPGLQPLAAPTEDELERGRELADRLWDTARLVRISDHSVYRPGPGGQMMSSAAIEAGVSASVLTPIGDSSTAFGLLWVAMVDHPRSWTAAETGIIQHLAADAAHGLMQANVLARNREVVEQLKALDRAKADFVSTVSHELRTPLTSITGYLEMLSDGDGGPLPDEAQRMLEIIDRNALRLRNLIEDLLTQSRIDAGRLRLNIERIGVHDLCERVQKSMRPLALAADIKLDFRAADELLAIEGDGPQLEQVLTNLVSNGIKFTPPGGTVAVEAHRLGTAVVITVRDTGMGIPADEISDLATRFFRASNAVAAAFAGTGLGLSIVAEIVERHGGTLSVDSEVDVGTTVEIRLPAAAS